jgi:hypothetical protein
MSPQHDDLGKQKRFASEDGTSVKRPAERYPQALASNAPATTYAAPFALPG